MSKYVVISVPYFPVFGLNTEIYEVNLRIQSKYRKIRTRNNYVFGHFSRSASLAEMRISYLAGEHLTFLYCRVVCLRLPIKLPTCDKISLLMTSSYKMVFFFKIQHTKSVLFIDIYYYAKSELQRDIRGWQ